MVTSFASDVSRALMEGRALAESLMLDACTVGTPTGTITNLDTGATTTTYTDVYAGKCKVQSTTSTASNPTVGGATFTVQPSEVHVPVGSFVTAVGQVVTLTFVALDPLLVGRVFLVVSLLHKSQATAYRLGVKENV